MGRLRSRLQLRLQRFARASEGVAIVEFALVAPLLLTLYLGSIEASSLFTMDRRVTLVAATVGDLVSQWDPSAGAITTGEINDYFEAANMIMTPYDSSNLKQVVSFLTVDPNGVAKVVWSKAAQGSTARTVDSVYPLDASSEMNRLARGSYLVVGETSYSYKPVLGLVFKSAIDLEHDSFFLPRFDAPISAQ